MRRPRKSSLNADLAPPHVNVSLSGLSPDKKWFVDEIGGGPVPMKTFSGSLARQVRQELEATVHGKATHHDVF